MDMTRRAALGSAAATLAAASTPRALAQSLTDNVPVAAGPALEPEVITVTDTGFAAWWRTNQPADTTVLLETLDGPGAGQTRELRLEESQTVHAARVNDLTPGTTYRYELRSNGGRVNLGTNAEADPGTFRTLSPPPGKLLARIALLNDIHVGETISGQIKGSPVGPIPPSYTTDDYSFKMLDAAITELGGRPLDLVVANGDLSDRGKEEDIARALQQLRRLPQPLLVTRGNHDRRLEGACATDGDCLRVEAFPEQAVGDATTRSFRRIGDRVGLVGLDSADPDSGAGRLDLADQPAWLDARLSELEAEGRIIVVFWHHPIRPADETDPPSFSDHVGAGREAIMEVLGRHPNVRLALHGHTHRNNLGFDPVIGSRLLFLENGAIKEYPGGFGLLDVYEGGIMRTFHRPVTDFTRVWVKTSAMQIEGFHPSVTRGNLASRAFVQYFDGTLVTAQPTVRTRRLTVRVLRRRGLGRFFERGLAVDVGGAARGAVVSVQLLGDVGDAARTTPLLIAAGRRRGNGVVRLRPRRRVRDRLRKRRRSTQAVVVVRAGAATVRRSFTLVR